MEHTSTAVKSITSEGSMNSHDGKFQSPQCVCIKSCIEGSIWFPKKGFKMSNLYENDDSAFVGDLDCNFAVDKGEKNLLMEIYQSNLVMMMLGVQNLILIMRGLSLHSRTTITKESPLRAQGNQGEQMESDCVYNEIEGEGTDTGQLLPSLRSQGCKNELKDGKSPTENRKPDMIHSGMQSPKRTPRQSTSPVIVREMLVSPERSPDLDYSPNGYKTLSSQQGCQDPSYSPRSQRQKHSSPERNGLVERVPSQDHASPTTKTSVSPPGFQKGSRHKHDSSRKRISASPKSSHSPPKYRRRDRSVSRTPIRRRDHKRDYRDRSRSRSPYSRDRHRSPRRRYSPRRRSSPLGYHSHHRSPRRRPWSPPRNRKTGVGLPGRNLFVAGFSFLTTERDLERKFSRFGRVRDVRIVRDKRSGDSRGFGFLSLERDEDADAAIRALDETEWNGRIILVEKSKSSGP
ncbi:hypothetical protein CMV_027039 [Castanea mollissima]|uniref:RRM domain-containing protein n=1 Tax=Castanea mollissima TaxID=60419 RepID=A0A8J4QIU0_9ROSI|nr:hypothetical protein CMV_027039 [Castanea mollissima]